MTELTQGPSYPISAAGVYPGARGLMTHPRRPPTAQKKIVLQKDLVYLNDQSQAISIAGTFLLDIRHAFVPSGSLQSAFHRQDHIQDKDELPSFSPLAFGVLFAKLFATALVNTCNILLGLAF